MKLNAEDIRDNRKEWEDKGYRLPMYDREEMIRRTRENPVWIHFGAGNIFRAFQANDLENMLNNRDYDRGAIAVGGRDHSIIDRMYHLHDDLSLLVTLKADGTMVKTVVGSVAESLTMDFSRQDDLKRLKEIFSSDSLQMASFTITEKGYAIVDSSGNLMKDAEADFGEGPENPSTYMGKCASLLYTRFMSGGKKIAFVSMDNCSRNGDMLKKVMLSFAKAWEKRGKVKEGFSAYIEDESRVSFPCTMIDKITPRPDPSILELLKRDGIGDIDPAVTPNGSYVAPFVNAEEPEYLVVEDVFPNGRPPLEKGGVIFTDKETVDKSERMKVCTCLNPLHTSLAVFGCLLGFTKMSDEMQDPDLRALCEGVGYTEGLPVVTDPGILNPREFIDTVVKERIPNAFLPDTPQRIATDTSQKIPIRFGATVRAYMEDASLSTAGLKLIPLVLAGWLRYLMGVDDNGEIFERSHDPLLDVLTPYVEPFKLGDKPDDDMLESRLHDLLSNEKIFGVNLYDAGIAGIVKSYFRRLISGTGAVRGTLHEVLNR